MINCVLIIWKLIREAIKICLIQHFEADFLWINPENFHPCNFRFSSIEAQTRNPLMGTLANSEDPDEMLNTAFYHFLHCRLSQNQSSVEKNAITLGNSGFTVNDIKKLMFCTIQCKLKICISILIFTFYIINQIFIIIFHPNVLVILKYFIWYGGVGTASERKFCT